MGMPKLLEEHKKLAILVGTWEGEETLHPSPWDQDGGVGQGLYVNRMDLDDFVLISDYVQTQAGAVTYRGHGVFGWDPRQSRYLMHWSDNMSGIALKSAPGEWRDNVLCFRDQSEMGHGRYTYTFLSENRFTFSLDHSRDGDNWSSFMDGSYIRK